MTGHTKTFAVLFVSVALLVWGCAEGLVETDPDIDDDDGGTGASAPTGTCGDGTCSTSETCDTCPADCRCEGCGDGVCGEAEDCNGCASDCGECAAQCGNGMCEGSEDCNTCAADCGQCAGSCGDGTCDAAETCTSCATDCGACPPVCGNGTCEATESAASCPADCGGGTCAHSPCVEGVALDPLCDPCVDTICTFDSFCCTSTWDDLCAGDAPLYCSC